MKTEVRHGELETGEEMMHAGVEAGSPVSEGFVAINYITCSSEYRERFETLFQTRAHAIDRISGFLQMYVLRPKQESDAYLVVSHWKDEESFRVWLKSPAFLEGHKRGFEDVQRAKEAGLEPPMTSDFRTYEVIAR
jgi:heme-degrading monooxygenase HmoA